jgi:beta-glucanase (GH16 family)
VSGRGIVLPWLAAAPLLVACGQEGGPSWVLVAADEFDGPQGSSPDPAFWSFDLGGSGFGNGESQYYTDRPANAALDGEGHLVITALREAMGGRQYTSARLTTRGKHELTYGRVEGALRLPEGKGMWPAFWLLGANYNRVGWPDCGEIDVMENRGDQPGVVLGSLHGPGYSGGNAVMGEMRAAGGSFADGMHRFAVEWQPGLVRWSADDTIYHEVRATRLPGGADWVFDDHPFFIILDLAVGGHFGGEPDASTSFPQALRADYLRIYARGP